ncbi:hypothetical protein PVAP13_1KG046477 [Panicum virgatum]|uniref:Uncharacterized protein n=1 Tax=Panicum virgatum TaxID=38727 RepID=A0A8T0X2M2_PANVG|nr:hypothetical protein PVAP13_1KG046477 [Panicum virgatum]
MKKIESVIVAASKVVPAVRSPAPDHPNRPPLCPGRQQPGAQRNRGDASSLPGCPPFISVSSPILSLSLLSLAHQKKKRILSLSAATQPPPSRSHRRSALLALLLPQQQPPCPSAVFSAPSSVGCVQRPPWPDALPASGRAGWPAVGAPRQLRRRCHCTGTRQGYAILAPHFSFAHPASLPLGSPLASRVSALRVAV